MKKILLATTALVASASFAMADVDLSGSAEMGVVGGENTDGSDRDGQFHTDIDVDFSMSGETDGGLTFGASVDLDSTDDDGGSTGAGAFNADEAGSDTSIFVSGSLGTLTMGDTDGAVDFVMREAILGGTIDDVHEHAGYNGNNGLDGSYDGQVARYDYSFGDYSIALSAEIDDDSDTTDIDLLDDFEASIDAIEDDTVLGIGGRYAGTFGGFDLGVGLGYQQAGDSEVVGFSLDMSTGGFTAILNYMSFEDSPVTVGDFENTDGDTVDFNVDRDDHIGVAVGYQAGAILVAANYGIYDTELGDIEGYGIVANYDLGGGAELQAGYAHSDYDDINDFESTDNYSFGISMSF